MLAVFSLAIGFAWSLTLQFVPAGGLILLVMILLALQPVLVIFSKSLAEKKRS